MKNIPAGNLTRNSQNDAPNTVPFKLQRRYAAWHLSLIYVDKDVSLAQASLYHLSCDDDTQLSNSHSPRLVRLRCWVRQCAHSLNNRALWSAIPRVVGSISGFNIFYSVNVRLVSNLINHVLDINIECSFQHTKKFFDSLNFIWKNIYYSPICEEKKH